MQYVEIPENVKQFLTNCIESVGQLEVLFFFLASPQKEFDSSLISKELRSHPTSALNQMIHLSEHGVLKKTKDPDLFIYSPKNSDLHETITRLYKEFHEKPVKIISFLYDKPQDKLKDFANAFKLKKD